MIDAGGEDTEQSF